MRCGDCNGEMNPRLPRSRHQCWYIWNLGGVWQTTQTTQANTYQFGFTGYQPQVWATQTTGSGQQSYDQWIKQLQNQQNTAGVPGSIISGYYNTGRGTK